MLLPYIIVLCGHGIQRNHCGLFSLNFTSKNVEKARACIALLAYPIVLTGQGEVQKEPQGIILKLRQ